jgi:hypothetical protein
MGLLREKLLEGRRIAVAGLAPTPVTEALQRLGAQIESLNVEELSTDEDRVGEWARARAPLHGLVYGSGAAFGAGGQTGLDATLERTWVAVREVALGALIEAPSPAKLLLIAPRPDSGPLASAACAALENLSRTLSVEWARYFVTAVLIAPGERSTDQQLAELACFALSEAGEYLSGCRLEVGAVA